MYWNTVEDVWSMPDDERIPMIDPERELGAALRALPMPAPERSEWPRLAATLASRRRTPARRFRPAFAAAAAVALAAVLVPYVLRQAPPAGVTPGIADANPTVADARDADDLRAATLGLIARNQALESWLRAAGEPLDAGAAFASAELQDLIGMVDVQLSVADDPQRAQTLWRERLDLMQQLAEVRRGGRDRLIADGSGDGHRSGFVNAAYRID